MHIELRVRIVCELVLNQQCYLHPEIVSFIGGFIDDELKRDKPFTPRLQATSASYEKALSLEDGLKCSYFNLST